MAAKSKIVMRSNFGLAARAGREFVRQAVGGALDEGEAEGERRLERGNDMHGYNLPMDIQQEKLGEMDGRIVYPEFFGRFFEYGTVHLPAIPFMRPAHRKMRKRFKDEMGDKFEGYVRRRAGIRGLR